MSETESSQQAEVKVNLKNPYIAAALALLFPGAGHFYQGRTAKGLIFCLCIMGLFIYGLVLSSGEGVGWGRAVYKKWNQEDKRFYFFGQVFVGLPAAPAFIQSELVKADKPPILFGLMAPPIDNRKVVLSHGEYRYAPLFPGDLEIQNKQYNFTFHQIRKAQNKNFELGTLFTVVAGLLNLLVVFDAAGGVVVEDETPKRTWFQWAKQFVKKAVSS